MTLVYQGMLPPGALVRQHLGAAAPAQEPAPLAPPPAARPATAAIWLSAAHGEFDPMPADPGRIRRWIDPIGEAVAVAVASNKQGTRHEADAALPALVFAPGDYGGLVLSGAVGDSGRVSFGALLQTVAAEPETLLALHPLGMEDHLYLSAQRGEVRLGQEAGGLRLAQHADLSPGQPLLVLCSLDGPRVQLRVNGGAAVEGRLVPPFAGPADLFIGCRGPRPRQKRKLGGFLLTDVFLWSGEGLDGADAEAALTLWRERAHGV